MISSDNRRISERMLDHWNRLRGQNPWPASTSIRAVTMPDLWDDIFIVRVKKEAETLKFEYTFQGKNVMATLNNAMLALKDDLTEKFTTVYTTRNYVHDERVYTNRNGVRINYRQIILPLGPDNDTIDHLLGGMRHMVDDSNRVL